MYKNVTIHDCIINRRHGRGESKFKYPMQAHKLVRLVSSLGANMLNSSLNMFQINARKLYGYKSSDRADINSKDCSFEE